MTMTRTHAPDTTVNDTRTALAIDSVSKRFGPAAPPVLEDISLDVGDGKFAAVIGPSGCGKTTLLRIIQGLETTTSGAATAHAHGHGSTPRMSYVFQSASLLPWYSVRKNVEFGVTLAAGKGIYPTKAARNAAVDDLLELTDLAPYAEYYPNQISGGMQQRVNVARALAVRPDVLLLDEPFGALDALTRERLQVDVAGILSQLGTTAVLVTHDIREAVFMSNRVVVLGAHPGRVREIIDVEPARPRAAEFQHSTQLAELERTIWHKLHG